MKIQGFHCFSLISIDFAWISMDFDDFQDFQKSTEPSILGGGLQTDGGTFPHRKRAFWERFGKFYLLFFVFLIFWALFNVMKNFSAHEIIKNH